MTKYLERDMDRLNEAILANSSRVEGMIDKAMLALCERRLEFVEDVAAEDFDVDQEEIRIEEECLKLLALHQPVAADLRRITTVLKINNDLERVADLAVNIAERAQGFGRFPDFEVPSTIKQMSSIVVGMVRQSLDAFIHLDSQLAREVRERDNEVDSFNVAIIEELQQLMQSQSELVVPALHCFSAARHLERIGDLATNISADVIYLVDGDIVRHQNLYTLRNAE